MNLKLNEYIIDVNILEIKDAKARDEHLLVKLKELDPNAKPAENPKYYEVEIDGWIFWVDRESYEIKKKDDQEIIIGQGAIIFKDLKWNNEEAEVTIEKTTNDNLQLQYKIDDGEYKLIESGSKITNLKLGNLVTARLWDGTNGRNTASINVQDITNPTEAIIEFENAELIVKSEIQAKIIQNDNESGVDIEKSKWVYNTISESIGLDENSYTGGTFKTTTETISLTAETEGTYYLHILTIDKAGNKTETISRPLSVTYKGIFAKYDVEYTDIYMNYEYTNTNGWRILDYDFDKDKKTLTNVKLISTGIPAKMYYYYKGTKKNYTKWITDSTKLSEFKNNVLGTDYTTYTGNATYYGLQASAGFYYNLNQMTFEQGTSASTQNQGYYKKVKNKDTTYTSGEIVGNNLFNARDDASIRCLTLTELNNALKRENVESTNKVTNDVLGLYQLSKISTETSLINNVYDYGDYLLASPYPETNNANEIVYMDCYDNGLYSSNYGSKGIRPVICISSEVKLQKKTDDTGFEYYEMVNAN